MSISISDCLTSGMKELIEEFKDSEYEEFEEFMKSKWGKDE